MKYDHKKIEKKWQKIWEKAKLYATAKVPGRNLPAGEAGKMYVLDMFPYPSGAGLHVGHPEGYTATDIYSRYLRMNGYDVLHPMGWDAFGLPAENYAIKEGIHPAKSTQANIKRFREQIKMLGLSYDWERELDTSSPGYYKWTQWLFLKLYEKGLAYRKEAYVNWCPSCQTVLANEQVKDGVCERCESEVVQKLLPQWFFKITDYAERLLEGLDKIDWPEPIKLMQRNWIGRSEGAEISFPIVIPAEAGIQDSGSRVKPGMTEKGVKRFVLLHGYTGRANKNFFPWIKKEISKLGFECYIPDLPHTESPTVAEQVKFVLRNASLDKGTVLLGHSLGGAVALKTLEKFNGKIAGLVLVGTPINNNFKDKKPRNIDFDWKFNFSKIGGKTGFVKILSDPNDYAVPLGHGRILRKKLGGELIEIYGKKPHFTGTKEPEILKNLISAISGSTSPSPSPGLERGKEGIKVFTTRPDTLPGATFLVVAPEHPFIKSLESRIENLTEVKKYIEQAKKKTELQRLAKDKEKIGIELKGIRAVNPLNGELLPIWVADYALMGFGTGALFGDAHDERDQVFAKKYKIPLKVTLKPADGRNDRKIRELEEVFVDDGILYNSGEFDGLTSAEARKTITKWLKDKGLGKNMVSYKLRDWLISRQRYWGAPIPIIYCEDCGMQPVPEKYLPVKLPTDVDFRPTGQSPLARSKSFNKVRCPKCGKQARRETDTMDTFVDSAWYWLRYTDPHNSKQPFDKGVAHQWVPVDVYVGGAEHAVLHLMYARFFCKALFDLGHLKFEEPFLKLRNQGLILGPDGQKMSKSRGNVINPDDVVDEYGADSMRMYEMFMGPLEDAKPWSTEGIRGVRRFLEKVTRLSVILSPERSRRTKDLRDSSSPPEADPQNDKILHFLHKTIKKVTEDIKTFKFNTAISSLMIFANELSNQQLSIRDYRLEIMLKLLAPFAPHLAEELWQQLGHKKSIHLEKWPEYEEKFVREKEISVAVQINGKYRATVKMAVGASEKEVRELARKNENVQRHLAGKKIKKVIYVRGKIINFVI